MTVKGIEGANTRDVVSYKVARFSDFDPEGSPAAGTLAELATTTEQEYNDYDWSDLPQGWYAYGVKALYTSGLYSEYSLSDITGHLMDHRVTVNVALSTGFEPSGVEVTLQGLDYPHETYMLTTSATGSVTFEPVMAGCIQPGRF